MVAYGDPPAKKPRRDDGPTLNAIAPSNATVPYPTGLRHKRWTHGFGEQNANDVHAVSAHAGSRAVTNGIQVHVPVSSLASSAFNTYTPAVSSPRGNNATAGASRGNNATASASSAPSPPEVAPVPIQQPRPMSRTTRRPQQSPLATLASLASELVHREVHVPVPAGNASGRKSMGAITIPQPAAPPGLPSPAPSDENNTASPTFTENHLQQRRSRPSLGHARQYAESWRAPPTRTSVSASPVVMSPPQHSSAQQRHLQQAGYPQPALPAMRGRAHANSHRLHRSSINKGPLPPEIAQIMPPGPPVPTPPAVPSNHPQPQQLRASRVPVDALLHRLSDVENDPTHPLSQTEVGRLILLREAVHKQDWFYQMTSQLFCMRSGNPGSLPQSLLNLNPRCWDYLGILLCPNTDISPRLLPFFQNFPEPIMQIYSDQSQARQIYEMRLRSIRAFLHKMPTEWESLVARCKDLQVPPLVQDLVENLNVNSQVLQTTIFRAITRMLYGPNEIPLMSAVEKLHYLDQAAWIRHPYKRSPHEKSDAYTKLHSVWKCWSAWKHQRGEAATFEVPADVLEFFSTRTPNPFQQAAAQVMTLQQAQSTNQQQQPSYHQQLVNRYAQAQGHVHPGRSSSASSQAMSPLTQPQHQAGLMSIATGWSPINARGSHAPGTPYGRSRHLYPSSQDGYRAQPTQPDPVRSALHQARLHSPVLTSAKIDSEDSRLYRHVFGFSLPPTELDRRSPLQTITFDITAPVAEQLAQFTTDAVDTQSLMLRLRCSTLPASGFASESAWVIADNYWPEEVTFKCNGVNLETRRKLHHGRYLPVDLTKLVTAGENTLTITASCKKVDRRHCAVAVEVIGFTSHDRISKQLSFVTAEQSLATIMTSLSGHDDGDDDLAVTSSTMTIKLIDPYSGCRIFDTPVRGATCLHKDCFDLETFLSMCKRRAPDAPTVVDCWRCPLCRGDVRPQTLLVDGFMVQVREELAQSNRLDTRAIIVEADGSWKPKVEEATGVRSPSLSREPGDSVPPPPSIPKAAPKPPPIVIELD